VRNLFRILKSTWERRTLVWPVLVFFWKHLGTPHFSAACSCFSGSAWERRTLVRHVFGFSCLGTLSVKKEESKMDKEMRRPSKLTLGAVQLGLRYGIANRDGMPDESAAQEILEEAWQRGITSFDTAAAYGESERRIGAFVKRHPELAAHLFIATKGALEPTVTLDDEAYKSALFERLEISKTALNVPEVPLYMAHRYEDYRRRLNAYTSFFGQAKDQGHIRLAGISLYTPEEAEEVLRLSRKAPLLDALQIPFNLFDRRFLENELLDKLKAAGFMLFIRSVYLQGLLFLSPDTLPSALREAAPLLRRLQSLSSETGVGLREMALGYAHERAAPDSILIGVETVTQLRENLDAYEKRLPSGLIEEIDHTFSKVPTPVLDPRKW